MPIYNLILVICWAVYLFYWFISSLNVKKNKNGNLGWWIGRGLIIFAIVVLFHSQFKDAILRFNFTASPNPTMGIIGDMLAIIGVGFAIWARKHLGTNWGTPRTIKENPDLVTSGPYEYVRHPIYAAVLLAIFGSVLVTHGIWLIVFFGGLIYFLYSAKKEEQDMVKEFGEKYKTYMKRTKLLIPFIY